MSQGFRTRDSLSQIFADIEREADELEQLRNVALHAPRHRPIPRRLYRIARQVWNAGVVLIVGAVLWALFVLLFSLDERPDVAADSERHWRAYQEVRER